MAVKVVIEVAGSVGGKAFRFAGVLEQFSSAQGFCGPGWRLSGCPVHGADRYLGTVRQSGAVLEDDNPVLNSALNSHGTTSTTDCSIGDMQMPVLSKVKRPMSNEGLLTLDI